METLPQAKLSASRQSAQDFIQSIFSPMVTVLASDDAETVCQKNGLSFVELVRPFSQLSNEAHIRDPVNPAVVIPIRNLKINMIDLSSPGPPAPLVHRVLNEVVTKTLHSVDISAISPVEQQMQGDIPWYDAFKDCFFQLLRPMDHEFTRHILACVIVVSSHHPDPMSAFSSLGTKQTNLQQSSDRSNPYIKWFSSSTFKYYVLVHDVSDGEDTKADAVFQSMKSVYGSHVCFHLQINSRPKLLPNAPENIQMPDPWSQYLYPFGDEALDLDDEADDRLTGFEKSRQPTQAELEKTEEKIISELERAEQLAQASLNSPLRFQDPLTSMHYNETLEDDESFNDLGPLKPGPPDIVKDIAATFSKTNNSEKEVRVNEYRKSLKQFSFYSVAKLGNMIVNRQKGQCLTVTDHDRIKAFVYEFAIRGLLPHIEKLMRTISEQILSRKGIHRSIVNVTKKWFGSNKSAGGSLGTGLGSGVSYPSDAPELQQRKLGDLAFLVQHYELAFNSYHTAKRDFNNEHAWMYFAGALEMAAISAFMQGPQRSYPVHYFEACISTYLNTCRMPEYATRACLMSTEALKARGMYADAAFEYIKLTNEDSDLRSALLLEQAAYCYLHNKPPMFRKYAFHMILAGHRYSKAVQRKHTLRCYANALQIYKDRNWTLAEDHVNFIIGRQCFNLGQLDNATNALQQLLVYESQQHPIQQASHLREFLTVFKQNAEQQRKMTGSSVKTSLPELPLPSIDASATRVLLSYSTNAAMQVMAGSPFTNDPNRSRTIIAGQYSFKRNYGKAYVQRWSELEKKTVQVVTGDVPYPWKPHIPCLSSAVRNAEMPNCVAGERIAVEVLFINPLRLPLNLLNLHLLWEFIPEDNEPVAVTNELEPHDETVITEFIDNVTLKNHEKRPVSLSLVPQKLGNLRISGLVYTLSSVGVTGAVDEEGKVELIQQNDNGLAAVGVEGLQRLTVRGPRLNGTKKEKTSIMYGKDSRLDIRVLPPLPLLEVSMIDFPISLLCGEIRQTSFKFVNQGERPLKNLYLASSKKDCFSVRAPPDNACDFGTESEIYETLSNCSIHVSEVEDSAIATPQDVTRIPLPAGKLLSGAGFHLPIWIHGINTPGVHELDFLFYYEPAEPHGKVRYRVIHQTVRIQTLSTLSVSVRTRRCDVNRTKSFSVEQEENEPETESYLVSVDIENKAQGLTFPRCVEFSVSQITCFAKNLKLGAVSQLPSGMPSLKPGESLTLHFKTTAVRPSFDTDNTLVSQISFGNALIDGSKAPAIDFFIRSGMNANLFKTNNTSIEGTGFILFWQTSFIDDSCVRHTVNGQTYASVSKVETNQGDLSWGASKNMTQVDGRCNRWSMSPVAPDVACPVDIYLFHPSCVSHDFRKARCCVIQVEVHLKNVDTKTVTVAMDVKSNSCQSPSPTLSSGSPPIVELVSTSPDLVVEASQTTVPCWVGRTKIQLALEPQEEQMVSLHALVSHPGTYDLNSITFREIQRNTEFDYRPLTTINAPSVVCVTGN